MIAVIPAEAWAADSAATQTSQNSTGDILWLVGTVNGGSGYTAQGFSPDATQVAQVEGVDHAVGRSADGKKIAFASAQAGVATMLTFLDAGSGRKIATIPGGVTWPAQPDLDLSFDAEDGVTVSGTCYVGTPVGTFIKKDPLSGRSERVVTRHWQACRATERFAASGEVTVLEPLAEVPLDTTTTVVRNGKQAVLLEDGAGSVKTLALPSRASGRGESHSVADKGDLQLRHVGTDGRMYFMDAADDLVIRQPDGSVTRASLRLDPARRPARPLPVQVAGVDAATVAVLDTGRQYLALVNAQTGREIKVRALQTATPLGSAENSTGDSLAVDSRLDRLYVLDKSGISGGLWVHHSRTLEVIDRWHSSIPFQLVWAAPESGTVYLQTREGPLAVHRPDGSLVGFVSSTLSTTRVI